MRSGLEIESIAKDSPAMKVGLCKGDVILSINGNPTRDLIDFLFYASEPVLNFKVARGRDVFNLTISRDFSHPSDLGITPKMFKTRVCKNRCLFCFVKQLPKGLRKSLYIKDEDYRLSFLYGSYITLSNITAADKDRIITQRLSPLYISVHSTDNSVREQLLRLSQKQDILSELRFLAQNKIYMHTQIVLCPGYNDKSVLKKTISDLCKLYPYVQSIAVVPVGLTQFASSKIKPVSTEDALEALEIVDKFHKSNKRKYGEGVVYPADELFIKAGLDIPPKSYYDDFPQIENGVGLIASFLAEIKKLKIPSTKPHGYGSTRFITFTGESFFPYLHSLICELQKTGLQIECVKVANDFFGRSITVAGLLTGRDILKALCDVVKPGDTLIVPDVMLKEGGSQFLDDVTTDELADILKVKTMVTSSDVKSLLRTVGLR